MLYFLGQNFQNLTQENYSESVRYELEICTHAVEGNSNIHAK